MSTIDRITRIKRVSKSLSYIFTIITLVISVITVALERKNILILLGGSMVAKYRSHIVNNGDWTHIVCTTDTINTALLHSITPCFVNTSKYSLKDFSLSFEAECINVILVPTSFFETHNYQGKQIFQYKNTVLEAHKTTKDLISSFKLTDSIGYCFINCEVSYNGIRSVFACGTATVFHVLPELADKDDEKRNNYVERIYPKVWGKVDYLNITNNYQRYCEDVTIDDMKMIFSNGFEKYFASKRYSIREKESIEFGEAIETILLILWVLLAFSGIMTLFFNIIIMIGAKLSVGRLYSFGFKDALDCTTVCFSRKDFHKFVSKRQAMMFLVWTYMSLLSPIILYFLIYYLAIYY